MTVSRRRLFKTPPATSKAWHFEKAGLLFAQRSWQTLSLLVSDQALFMGN